MATRYLFARAKGKELGWQVTENKLDMCRHIFACVLPQQGDEYLTPDLDYIKGARVFMIQDGKPIEAYDALGFAHNHIVGALFRNIERV